VRDNSKKYSAFVLLFVLLAAGAAFSQSSNSWEQSGGVNDIFDFPVGANAMSMGGAYVSVAKDPFALYWNPATLENVPQMSLGLYYSNLAAGTQYNYLAYVHPTLFTGTFAAGILRLSTGDVPNRDLDPTLLGMTNYGRTLFLFGYGLKALDWMSFGTTLKVERLVLPNYPDASGDVAGSLNESAFGADVGFLFTPRIPIRYLNDISVGFNLQNALKRSVSAIEERDSTPRNLRLGLSKEVAFGERANHVTVSFEIDSNERNRETYHLGFEYSFQQNAMLRLGYYDGHPTYGAGAKLAGLQLDYSYWNGWDSLLGSSHRISLVFNVGKDREQKIAEYRERELRRIEEEVMHQRQLDRNEAILSGLSKARMHFANGDYIHASVAINKALVYDETGNDPDLAEARGLAEQINKSIDDQRRREEAEALKRSEEEARLKRRQQLVDEHYQKALAAFGAEDFPGALAECDRGLEIDPGSGLLKDLRSKAETDLKLKLDKLMQTAYRMSQEGRIVDAIGNYSKARQLAIGNSQYETYISSQLSQLESRLNFEELYRRGLNYERNLNWSAAADLYKDAMRLQPSNQALKKKFEEANVRANAKEMAMPDNVKELYAEGLKAYRAARYDEAVRFFEEARKLQPLNKTILRALDTANEQKQRLSPANTKED